MSRGMGRVQRAVRSVLYEAVLKGEAELTTDEITTRTFRKLLATPGMFEKGWRGPSPREHHYAAVRRALRTLGEHDPDLKLGVEPE